MLFHLASPTEDSEFEQIIESIRHSLWPEEKFNAHRSRLPAWQDPPKADQRLKEIRESLETITSQISEKKDVYTVYGRDASSKRLVKVSHSGLPFVDRYHLYFLQRQWEYPYRDPRENWANLFRLKEPGDDTGPSALGEYAGPRNYSKHWDNHNHFTNVVAATARLIEHFSDEKNTQEALQRSQPSPTGEALEHIQSIAHQLSYQPHPNLRTFKLLLAAYYHDLGKTVEDHRHGMEGASILSNNTTDATELLCEVFKQYIGPDNQTNFQRDDLLQIAHLICYHDQFGMLATGEAGYARLVEILHRIRRSTITQNIETQRCWSRWHLFDLWILNLADIMVSLDNKYELQCDLWKRKTAQNRITYFLNDSKAHLLRHDFRIALKLMESQNESQHADDLSPLEESAMAYAKRHAIERIRRLMIILMVDIRATFEREFKDKDIRPAIALFESAAEFSDAKWNSTIARCIYSLGDYGEFIQRFCWIGQMDYAFGFLIKIARRAMWLVNEELLGKEDSRKTGWVYQSSGGYPKNGEKEAWRIHINADCFADNLASTVVQILHHLLFREREIGRLRNLEFWVANQRLTNEKIDRIIAQEGPFRTRSSVQSALECIFLW